MPFNHVIIFIGKIFTPKSICIIGFHCQGNFYTFDELLKPSFNLLNKYLDFSAAVKHNITNDMYRMHLLFFLTMQSKIQLM